MAVLVAISEDEVKSKWKFVFNCIVFARTNRESYPQEKVYKSKEWPAKRMWKLPWFVTFSYLSSLSKNYMLCDMTYLWQPLCAFLSFISLYDIFCILQRPYLCTSRYLFTATQNKYQAGQYANVYINKLANWLLLTLRFVLSVPRAQKIEGQVRPDCSFAPTQRLSPICTCSKRPRAGNAP